MILEIHFEFQLCHGFTSHDELIEHLAVTCEGANLGNAASVREFWDHDVTKDNVMSNLEVSHGAVHVEWNWKLQEVDTRRDSIE